MSRKKCSNVVLPCMAIGFVLGVFTYPILCALGFIFRFLGKVLPVALALTVTLHAADLTSAELARKAAIVRIVEGDRFYGVRSIKVTDGAQAFRITTNSICKSHARWEKAGRPGEFVDFFAARWCPAASDPVGNRSWRRNARYYKF
mgnify:FL=1